MRGERLVYDIMPLLQYALQHSELTIMVCTISEDL